MTLLLISCYFSVISQPQGKPENIKIAQEALLKRAKANSDAQLGQYDPSNESADAGERTYEKGYKVGAAYMSSACSPRCGGCLCFAGAETAWPGAPSCCYVSEEFDNNRQTQRCRT